MSKNIFLQDFIFGFCFCKRFEVMRNFFQKAWKVLRLKLDQDLAWTFTIFLICCVIAVWFLLNHQKSSSAHSLSHEEIASDRNPGTFLGDDTTTNRYAAIPKSPSSQNSPQPSSSGITWGTLQQQPGITSPGSLFFDGSTNFGGTDPLGTSMRSAGLSLPSKSPRPHDGVILSHPLEQTAPLNPQRSMDASSSNWPLSPTSASPSAHPRTEP